MRVYVVDVLATEPTDGPVETNHLLTDASINSITWIPIPRSIDAVQLDFFVANCAPDALRSDAVLVGLHPDSAAQVQNMSHVLEDVSKRVPGSLSIVAHSTNGEPTIQHVGATESRRWKIRPRLIASGNTTSLICCDVQALNCRSTRVFTIWVPTTITMRRFCGPVLARDQSKNSIGWPFGSLQLCGIPSIL